MTGIIGYHNLLEDTTGTVTASTEAAGYPKENAFDWRPYDWWKPTATGDSWIKVAFATAQTCDYFALAAHDLTTQGSTVKLQYSSDDISYSDAFTATGGTSDKTIFKSFTQISAKYWRVLVNNPTTIASLGVVSFGDRVDLVRGFSSGFTPPTLARNNSHSTTESEEGQFLGRSIIRKTYNTSIVMPSLTPTWVRTYWEPFADHAEKFPFFLSWDYDNYPNDSAMAWLSGDFEHPVYDTETTLSVNMNLNFKL